MRDLHVGVDGRELTGKPTGVARYLSKILHAWAADPLPVHRYTIFVPTPLPGAAVPRDPRFNVVLVPGAASGTLWEQFSLAGAVRRARPDVFLAPGYTAPLLLACPSVLIVHDVSFFAHPEWYHWREGARRRFITRAAAKRARTVVTSSTFSAGEIMKYLGIPASRIVVVPAGVGLPGRAAAEPKAPIVLFVGSLFNRRRIPEMIRGFALAAIRVPQARLVIVGDNRTRPAIDPIALASDLDVADRIEWKRYVPDDELERLYQSAAVFTFLSDYEGFAMTPMEAMAYGAVPILLDTPVAREVYADAALRVSAAPEDIARAMITLLTDEPARAALLAAGRTRLAHFSWPRAASAIRGVIERAAER